MLFDHEIEDCPTLITRIRDKGALLPPPTHNTQMMRSKPCKEDPNLNIVPRSGIAIGDDLKMGNLGFLSNLQEPFRLPKLTCSQVFMINKCGIEYVLESNGDMLMFV